MHIQRYWLGPALLLTVAGCGQQETVHSYRVPKSDVVYELNHVKATKPATTAAARPQRMLAAIVPHGSQGWFFKLTADPELVEKQAEAFDRFIRSLSFASGQEPKWTLPAGWRQLPGSEMRFATIHIDAGEEGPLDLSVTSLPRGENDDAYLLANINRWRGQLQLPPLASDNLNDEMDKIELDGATAYVVDLEGMGGDTGMGRAPFASGRAGPSAPLSRPAAGPPKAQAAASPIKYETPPGWQVGPTSMLRKAAFTVTDGDQRVEITVIDLEPGAGDLLANINRWRGQVGLADITQAALEQELKSLPVGGKQGRYVVLEGPGTAGKPQTILGVIVQHAGRPWFIKLWGDSPLAAREKERFEAFVKSIEFGATEGAKHGN